MSSTRSARIGAPLNQSRFCSAAEYSEELNGLVVAKRCAAIRDPKVREIVLFLQQRSLEVKGASRLADEFATLFPDEFDLSGLDGIAERAGEGGRVSGDDLRPLLAKIPKKNFKARYASCHGYPGCEWTEAAIRGDRERRFSIEEVRSFVFREGRARLARDLMVYCLDPSQPESFERAWYLRDPIGAFWRYRDWAVEQARASLAMTSVADEVFDLLDFARETESMVLAEGGVRLGKSWSLRAWCGMNPGVSRYVECPSTNDDRSFYQAVAESLGVASGTSYTGAQISARVIEMLRQQPVVLVIDEAAYCWPQKGRPSGVPPRILWLKTLHDLGVPIALIATPEFTRWQRIVVQKTGWDDGQFKGRLARYRRLPDLLGVEDLKQVARYLLPGGSGRTIDFLVGFALTASSGVAAISLVLKAARYRAKKAGRDDVSHEDIERAITEDMLPSENALATAITKNRARQQPKVSGRPDAPEAQPGCPGSADTSQQKRTSSQFSRHERINLNRS